MTLFNELQDQIRSYLSGRASFDVVYFWVAEHVQDVADAQDGDLQDLTDTVWTLASEWQDDIRDEPSVRQELTELVVLPGPSAARISDI